MPGAFLYDANAYCGVHSSSIDRWAGDQVALFCVAFMFLHREALALLFQALGLESRKAGDDGETRYGIPDRGHDDSEAVIKQVRRAPRKTQCLRYL